MFLFLGIAFALAAGYLMAQAMRPLFEKGVVSAEDWSRLDDEAGALLMRRDRIVDELRDLELESALNKIEVREMTILRARYEAEALDVVRALDEQTAVYADRIEAAVSDRLKQRKKKADTPAVPAAATPEAQTSTPISKNESPPCAACGAEIPEGARFCDGCGAKSAVPCVDCGHQNRPGAKFCAGCGATQTGEAS